MSGICSDINKDRDVTVIVTEAKMVDGLIVTKEMAVGIRFSVREPACVITVTRDRARFLGLVSCRRSVRTRVPSNETQPQQKSTRYVEFK